MVDNHVDIALLALVGGQSSRMGTDKSLLNYHGKKNQRMVLKHFAQELDIACFFSANETQSFEPHDNVIVDPYLTGPMGALFSAFERYPQTAWLVVPCDLPFLRSSVLKLLLLLRNEAKHATVYCNDDFLQPLVGVYEPSIMPHIKKSLDRNQHSLFKLLQSVDIAEINSEYSKDFINFNSLEDYTHYINADE